MSLQQIWGRLRGIARSQEIGNLFRREKEGDALHRAEELIREANERDRQEELKKFRPIAERKENGPTVASAEKNQAAVPPAYEAACRLLGVPPEATFEQITAAYRGALALHHPDRNELNGEEALRGATRRTQELNEAFGVIRRFRER